MEKQEDLTSQFECIDSMLNAKSLNSGMRRLWDVGLEMSLWDKPFLALPHSFFLFVPLTEIIGLLNHSNYTELIQQLHDEETTISAGLQWHTVNDWFPWGYFHRLKPRWQYISTHAAKVYTKAQIFGIFLTPHFSKAYGLKSKWALLNWLKGSGKIWGERIGMWRE